MTELELLQADMSTFVRNVGGIHPSLTTAFAIYTATSAKLRRFSTAQITLKTKLEIGVGGGAQAATPLFANGVLYGITNWSITFAVDATTGQEIWRYDPQVVPGSVRLCCGVINRGIALYQDKVIVPVVDGRLVARDAETGKVIWSVFAVPEAERQNYSITMAPRVIKNKVIIGNAGAEFAPYRGYIAAYNVLQEVNAAMGMFFWIGWHARGATEDSDDMMRMME